MTLPEFTRALTRRPAPNCADGYTTSRHLGMPDFEKTQAQYEAYINALVECGLMVTILPADERFPDGHYVEDPAVIFQDMAFITKPGGARAGEPESIEENLQHLNIVRCEGEEARIEGGDVLFCADRVLIGLTERTNREGAEQLKHALQSVQADLRVDFVPLSGVLHLKTGTTEIAPNVLLIHPEMRTGYSFDFAECIRLPAEEAYAADVMPINDTLFIPKGFPTVLDVAEQHYDDIIELEMSEFEKMDGGLTCLSLRY